MGSSGRIHLLQEQTDRYLRPSQLFAFSARAATGIALIYEAEMQRNFSYDKMRPYGFGEGNRNAPRNMDDYSDFPRRLWCVRHHARHGSQDDLFF